MSVNTKTAADPSTSNANWGTLVIVLVVVIIGVVVGVIAMRPHAESNPMLVNPPAAASQTP